MMRQNSEGFEVMGKLRDFERFDQVEIGRELHGFAADLYPICRSITGDGIRETLKRIQRRIPIQLNEVPTGTKVFDWTVPKEWNVYDAYIKDSNGTRILDFQRSNLHVVNYSIPVHATISLTELKEHLFTIPEHPDWIPYRTSYYTEAWGFCMSHNQMLKMRDGDYEVCIDSKLADGSLTYGEFYLPGVSSSEILISAHACHPSLANDNLSGLAVTTALAEFLAKCERYYSYRFLFIPGTIGSITWLSRNRDVVGRIRNGLVITCIGDAGGFHYKKSRQGDADVDKAMVHILRRKNEPADILEFSPYGYDERQYCSPGFNLPVGCLMRSVWGTFPEYHTSADNLDFIQPEQLASSLGLCVELINVLENNRTYQNLSPFCEPQLGKRNLYRPSGGAPIELEINARLWVLNFSDGKHTLLDIAELSGLPFSTISNAADVLCDSGLLAIAACDETVEKTT
jgi:aminopeptidase-like protein